MSTLVSKQKTLVTWKEINSSKYNVVKSISLIFKMISKIYLIISSMVLFISHTQGKENTLIVL